ncbi:MAG: GTPase ObgE [Patescibacteria group bacterium]
MLIDEIEVTFKGGDGGNGKVSFGKMAKSGPDGGNGGDGGDLWVESASDLTLLNRFSAQPFVESHNGRHGDKKKMSGLAGDDITVYLPVGTTIIDTESNEQADLDKVGKRILLCKGGKGGDGNWEFRGPTNTTPLYAQKGEKGQLRHLKLILKLISDYGLIGFPNAGKSSLLAELTNANPKVANYAFTTLSPNLGVLNKKIIADIPGLIEGAHEGKGLGIKFLKHIEKVRLLLHCISSEAEDVVADYRTIREELGSYNKELLTKKEIILLTKTDLLDKKQVDERLKKLAKLGLEVIPVSIHDPASIDKLVTILG